MRTHFDPRAYRIVLLDQRGCGRSLPAAGEPGADLSANDTAHLVADLELLRRTLGIDRWLVAGGSWGCVLALVYAETHPQRVRALVLSSLATGRRAETDLLTRGLGLIFPEPWRRFRDTVPESERDGDLAAAYGRLLEHPDPAVRETAIRSWCAWEDAMMPYLPPFAGFADPAFAATFVRLVTHYWSHGSWLAENQVLRDAHRLAGIPAVLIAGGVDLGHLAGTPWLLDAALPDAELVTVPAAGHTISDAGTVHALVTATDRFASTVD